MLCMHVLKNTQTCICLNSISLFHYFTLTDRHQCQYVVKAVCQVLGKRSGKASPFAVSTASPVLKGRLAMKQVCFHTAHNFCFISCFLIFNQNNMF